MSKVKQLRHDFVWEKIDGEVRLINAQTKEHIYTKSEMALMAKAGLNPEGMKYERLDNLEPDLDFVKGLFGKKTAN